MKKSEALSFKVDKELKDKLLKQAKSENRSLSNFVITVLKKYIEVDKRQL